MIFDLEVVNNLHLGHSFIHSAISQKSISPKSIKQNPSTSKTPNSKLKPPNSYPI